MGALELADLLVLGAKMDLKVECRAVLPRAVGERACKELSGRIVGALMAPQPGRRVKHRVADIALVGDVLVLAMADKLVPLEE